MNDRDLNRYEPVVMHNTTIIEIKSFLRMRAFISICALAAVAAAAGRTGSYKYHNGGDDWHLIYDYMNGNQCEHIEGVSTQSPINFNCADGECVTDDALVVSPQNYGKANRAIIYEKISDLDEIEYLPAVNMQISFPVQPTQSGGDWPAVKDIEKTEAEIARLHLVNKYWYDDGNCDDSCKIKYNKPCNPSANDATLINADYCEEGAYANSPYARSYIVNQVIYEDWPEGYGWSKTAWKNVWQTDYSDEDQEIKTFVNKPVQMHIHTPSEHQFNGKNYDAEIHWVHANGQADGTTLLSVIGYMFDVEEGDPNGSFDLIDELLASYQAQAGVQRLLNDSDDIFTFPMIDFGKFFDEVDTDNMYHYVGSLTTPPCTEGVRFYIMKQIQPLTQQQLEDLQSFTHQYEEHEGEIANSANDQNAPGNNRDVQPLNGRTIYMSKDPSASNAMALLAMVSPLVALLAF